MTTDDTDLATYRAAARAWLAANLPVQSGTAVSRSSHDVTPEQLAADRATQHKVFAAGYAGITLPVEYGGQGLTSAHEQIWEEESADYSVPEPGGVAWGVSNDIVLPTLLKHGSEEQKQSWIPKLLSAEEIWVQLLSEPDAGSDLAGLTTRATFANDAWVITGKKVWSSGAMSADFGVCLARSNWDVPKHRGLTWFKVPLKDVRVTVRPIRELNGGSEFCEEFLDDVVVSSDMVIGDVNEGWLVANSMLAFERSNIGRRAGGGERPGRRELAPDLVELATKCGKAHDPNVRQLIARAHTEDYVLGLLARRVATGMAMGKINPAAVSYLKLGQGIAQPERACAAMEIAGRNAIAWTGDGTPEETAAVNYLNGRIMAIAGGSNQIQRNIISERVLGLPREPSEEKTKSFRDLMRDARNWGR